jgi:hypothetical protein
MRIATAVAPILLLLPVSIWGQAQATSGTGHFDKWLSDAHWGPDKQTFDARFGIQHVEATFTVAENGFGWQRTFTDQKETFNSWADVTAWCWAPGTVLVRTRQDSSPRFFVYDLKPEDLAMIVDGYFKSYAAATEWSSPGWECTPAGLSRPNPADMSKIRELLEAASSGKR